jgi:hypothetical protein
VTDITSYRFPRSVQRHYERLTGFPEGLLVLGDALGSFNPFYRQGMSAAALQAQALQQLLMERAAGSRGLEGLELSFFPKAAEIIVTPWTLTTNQDLAYPQTQGERPAELQERTPYFITWIPLPPKATRCTDCWSRYSIWPGRSRPYGRIRCGAALRRTSGNAASRGERKRTGVSAGPNYGGGGDFVTTRRAHPTTAGVRCH